MSSCRLVWLQKESNSGEALQKKINRKLKVSDLTETSDHYKLFGHLEVIYRKCGIRQYDIYNNRLMKESRMHVPDECSSMQQQRVVDL